ncbi:MAG: protein kinase [Lachnospiraceae bacterium]|nr:protein kinase [Lachnospiraceae bacterium]
MTIEERTRLQYAKVFKDWRIEGDMIGRGSQGKTAVFRITKENSGFTETGALKIINIYEVPLNGKNDSGDEIAQEIASVKKKAENELAAMNRMKGHANIVSYHEFTFEEYKDEDVRGVDLLIRMDFLENIGNRVSEGVIFSEAEIIRMGRDLSRALTDCHHKGILHRDIKPDNIFKNEYGYLLGDFGIAKYSEENNLVASTMAGSYPYAAPEQFKLIGSGNSEGKYDYRVDIYALGLSLYELANDDKIPFATSTYKRAEDIQKRLNGAALPGLPSVSHELETVILKACAYKAEDRFQTAEEMLHAFEGLSLDGTPQKPEGRVEENLSSIEETFMAVGGDQAENREEKQPSKEIAEEKQEISAAGPAESDKRDNPPASGKDNSGKKKTVILAAAAVAAVVLIGVIIFGRGSGKKTAEAEKTADTAEAAVEDTVSEADGGVVPEVKQEEAVTEPSSEASASEEMDASLEELLKQAQELEEEEKYEEAATLMEEHRDEFKDVEVVEDKYYELCYKAGQECFKNDNRGIARDWYTIAAEGGHSEAQYILGVLYDSWILDPVDKEKAEMWYKKAAENGNLKAYKPLAQLYYKYKEYEKALEICRKADEKGDKSCASVMGELFYYGYAVETNLEEAKKQFEIGAAQDDPTSLFYLGVMNENGYAVEMNFDTARDYYDKAVSQNYIGNNARKKRDAMDFALMGFKYEKNKDFYNARINFEKADSIFNEQEANYKNTFVEAKLGSYYLYGVGGLEQNYNEAEKLFKAAAELYDPYGLILEGDAYIYKNGVKQQDLDEAERYYKMAVNNERNYPDYRNLAKAKLAALQEFKKGKDCYDDKDYSGAYEHYKEAYDTGYAPYAAYNIGLLFNKGYGVEKNEEECCKWMEIAADGDYFKAHNAMGKFYENGYGSIEKDLDEAKKYYGMAAKRGYQDAIDALNRLEKQ